MNNEILTFLENEKKELFNKIQYIDDMIARSGRSPFQELNQSINSTSEFMKEVIQSNTEQSFIPTRLVKEEKHKKLAESTLLVLSVVDDFRSVVTVKQILSVIGGMDNLDQSKVTRKNIDNALRSLQEKGYIQRYQVSGSEIMFGLSEWFRDGSLIANFR